MYYPKIDNTQVSGYLTYWSWCFEHKISRVLKICVNRKEKNCRTHAQKQRNYHLFLWFYSFIKGHGDGNLTSMYKLCSTHYMLLYHEVEAVFLMFALFILVLVGWLEKINERQLTNILDTMGRTEDFWYQRHIRVDHLIFL